MYIIKIKGNSYIKYKNYCDGQDICIFMKNME